MERASDPVVRREIASFVEDRYPGTALAQQAAADRRWSDKRADALQKQQEHDAEIRRYLQQPANEAEARAYAKLGTISSASGFERHEAFVSRYPSSPLAAEALYSMIVAVENGVAAPSRMGQSRESLLRSLRKRLVTEYPKSYRAREMMNADR